ncbi:MAG: hypothetical protein Q8N23_25040 [Archangium sp.]|nr:hypothetical protein [Archangium sp.]MDP3155963.1 hypothetical protein [Archangium sp.]MDP3576141.1 hypothetical protein [Archangium sp.]
MKTKLMLPVVLCGALVAFAAPPPGGKGGPGQGKWGGEDREERMESREREARLMYVVAISEALELNEAEALKLSEKLRVIEEKRRPLRQAMGEAMRSLKDAADNDAAALPQVDANVQKVLDGRAQMAAMDKELFSSLAQGYPPQKRAKLALVLARLNHEMKGFKKGRHGGR